MSLEHQILIFEWFVKGHVTLKTGVMMLKITGINYTLLYIHKQMIYTGIIFYCFSVCWLD